MLDAFKIKEFNLEPIYESWTDPPMFFGDPKKDAPVEDWLRQIRAGCSERKVPEEYWHKVAQHYMGETAKVRLEELKKVMAKVNGGKYRWSWKKFKIAMMNMGWDIDITATEPVQVHTKSSGIFWVTRKKTLKERCSVDELNRPAPVKTHSEIIVPKRRMSSKPLPTRSMTTDFFSKPTPPIPPTPTRSMTIDTTKPTPTRSRTMDSSLSINNENTLTSVSNAPTWLLNACNALDFLTAEHPTAMSTLSAILITAGTLPAIPAISAGAGGTVLASGVAQAVGAIAVGVGNWLKAQQDGQVQVPPHGQQQPS